MQQQHAKKSGKHTRNTQTSTVQQGRSFHGGNRQPKVAMLGIYLATQKKLGPQVLCKTDPTQCCKHTEHVWYNEHTGLLDSITTNQETKCQNHTFPSVQRRQLAPSSIWHLPGLPPEHASLELGTSLQSLAIDISPTFGPKASHTLSPTITVQWKIGPLNERKPMLEINPFFTEL